MLNSSENEHKERNKRRNRPFASPPKLDRLLLGIFLSAVFIVSISVILVPQTLESNVDLMLTPGQNRVQHFAAKPIKESATVKDLSIQNEIDAKNHLAGQQNSDIEPEGVMDEGVKRNRNIVDAKSSLTGHQNGDSESKNVADIEGKSNLNTIDSKAFVGQQNVDTKSKSVIEISEKSIDNEGYFLTHSSPYHTIFSTGCSIFQDWQSYVFFYHVFQSGQDGHTTRIASGCRDDDGKKLEEMFKKEIEAMRDGYHHLHLTPDFSRIPKKTKSTFKYFNKPFGVLHWMEKALGYPENHKLHDDSIIILMDPDQVMLRPFTNDFTNSSEAWRSAKKRKLKVEHGSPFAQQYGYGVQPFFKIEPKNVFLNENFPTRVSNLTKEEKNVYYFSMGPPYIATAKDMWSIASKWSEIAPLVHDEYPHLLAEMFAYNLAVAHLGLRHTIAHSFAVSDPWAGGEGWPLIDKTPPSNICRGFPKSELPHVIHYCQKYNLGKWFIGKYKLRKDFISCEAPLLTYPPDDLASRYTTAIRPGSSEIHEIRPKQAKEYAFMVCAMIEALNSASKFYKDQHCKDGSGNYNYTYVFHEDMSMPNETIHI